MTDLSRTAACTALIQSVVCSVTYFYLFILKQIQIPHSNACCTVNGSAPSIRPCAKSQNRSIWGKLIAGVSRANWLFIYLDISSLQQRANTYIMSDFPERINYVCGLSVAARMSYLHRSVLFRIIVQGSGPLC